MSNDIFESERTTASNKMSMPFWLDNLPTNKSRSTHEFDIVIARQFFCGIEFLTKYTTDLAHYYFGVP